MKDVIYEASKKAFKVNNLDVSYQCKISGIFVKDLNKWFLGFKWEPSSGCGSKQTISSVKRAYQSRRHKWRSQHSTEASDGGRSFVTPKSVTPRAVSVYITKNMKIALLLFHEYMLIVYLISGGYTVMLGCVCDDAENT